MLSPQYEVYVLLTLFKLPKKSFALDSAECNISVAKSTNYEGQSSQASKQGGRKGGL